MLARLRHLRHRALDGLRRDRLDHLQDDLTRGVVPGRFTAHAVASVTTSSNQLTVTGQDTLATGNPRVVLTNTANDLPAGLETGRIYWLRDAGTNTYTLHGTKSGAAGNSGVVGFTDAGTGTTNLVFLD